MWNKLEAETMGKEQELKRDYDYSNSICSSNHSLVIDVDFPWYLFLL
jgi:hypothetical protein